MPKDSINRDQPEENRRDLRAGAAVEKIKELAEGAKTCFFCTPQWQRRVERLAPDERP